MPHLRANVSLSEIGIFFMKLFNDICHKDNRSVTVYQEPVGDLPNGYFLWQIDVTMDIYELRKQRLREMIDDHFSGKVARFAAFSGIKSTQIHRWLSDSTTNPRKITEDSAREIEKKLTTYGIRPGEMDVPKAEARNLTHRDARRVPLISWVNAGKGDEAIDPYAKGDGEEMIAIDDTLILSKHSFALRIKGLSMVRPDGEGFHPGDIIIIDPMVKPKPGDYIVAYLELEDKSTFKKYRSRGMNKNGHPIFELVPLNPDYPTITVDESCPGRVVGTVMEYRKRRKESPE